jgi:hypothetical protein
LRRRRTLAIRANNAINLDVQKRRFALLSHAGYCRSYAKTEGRCCTVKRSLGLKLVLPLALLSAVVLTIHHWWDYGGALVNLAIGLVIVIFTVSYVDWVLRRHQAEQWGATDARIRQRLEVFVNSLITGVRTGLGFGPDILDRYGQPTTDMSEMHRRVLRASREVLDPQAQAHVTGLDQEGWKRLIAGLQSVWEQADRILSMFSHRLRPRQVELLLDIQSSIERASTSWWLLPDVMGVPLDRLGRTRTSPATLQSIGCESTAEELRQLMTLARELDCA